MRAPLNIFCDILNLPLFEEKTLKCNLKSRSSKIFSYNFFGVSSFFCGGHFVFYKELVRSDFLKDSSHLFFGNFFGGLGRS